MDGFGLLPTSSISLCHTHTNAHTHSLIPTDSDKTSSLHQTVYVCMFVCASRQRAKRLEFVFLRGFCVFHGRVCLFTCLCVFAPTVACLPMCSPHPSCVCFPVAGVPPLSLTIALSASSKSPHCLGGQTFQPLTCREACSEW